MIDQPGVWYSGTLDKIYLVELSYSSGPTTQCEPPYLISCSTTYLLYHEDEHSHAFELPYHHWLFEYHDWSYVGEFDE